MTSHPGHPRTVRAFALAPLAAPVACAGALLIDNLARAMVGSSSATSVTGFASLVLAVGAIGAPLAYAAALIAGAPVYLLLRRLGMVTRWTLWLAGSAIGAVVAVLVQPQLRGELFTIPFPWWAGATLGLISAETFRRLLSPRPR